MAKLSSLEQASQIVTTEKEFSEMPLETCPRHGCVKRFETVFMLGESLRLGSGCLQCDQEAAKEVENEESRRREIAFPREQTTAGIPLRYRGATLSPFPITAPGQEDVLDAAKDFSCTSGEDSTGFILMGKVGAGKTNLACAVLNEFLRKGLTARFLSAVQAVRFIKDSWRKDSDRTENQAIKSLLSPHLLIIDEIGVQFGSETEHLFLNEIVNERYNAKKPTILVTNLDMKGFTELLGDRVVDRFREGGRVLVFDWGSQRQRNNK